ncbi:S66 peptidase family protein [Pseudalkalibacillus decolorationis]|uniref:S66 peptidase family protein n=1 Tax=Pseudalkalibacillus decolorationis TaxID=163879 RepID=UPI002148E20B|nr:LD-carboxypeptidase [Pseudalkalibacillus decolorationis]
MRPPILQQGDTIGIVTLGSPLDAGVINARINTLRNMGFNIIVGQYVYSQNGFLAATAQERAFDLMNMFQNEQVKMILPTRGGVGVAGILPYLNYEIIQQNPKIISGYSDITVLLNFLSQCTGLITFHSLMLIDFTPETPVYNFNQFYSVTSTITSTNQIENPPARPLIGRVPGLVTGRIVGGNLTSFIGTLGTPFEIDTKGKILFLEETHEPINTVYRYMNHLKMAGKFDDCIGIIMGDCTDCPVSYGKSYEELINDFVVPLGKPLMTNLASGHGIYKAAIPIGAITNMNTINRTITVLEPTVSL